MNSVFYDIGVAVTLLLCFLVVAIVAYAHGLNVGRVRGMLDSISEKEGGAK